MDNRPRVSVVVPHYRDLERLDLCLAALQGQTYPRDKFEVIVADNASPEGEAVVAGIIAGRARLTVVTEKGAGPARNGGVAEARGAILAFTDSDCLPGLDWLAQGVAALAHCDFAGGAMQVLVQDERSPTPAECFERVFAFDNQTYVTRKRFSVTANLFCPRAVFDRVGGFRVGVSEDLDWCLRAGAAGYRIGYASGAVVGHPARRSWAELVGKWRRVNAETFALARAGRMGRVRWAVKCLLLPVSALAHTPRVLMTRKLRTAAEKVTVLVTLYRLRFWRLGDGLRLLSDGKSPP